MKLIRCHIENFGKLSGYDYDFTDGLNTIKEDTALKEILEEVNQELLIQVEQY